MRTRIPSILLVLAGVLWATPTAAQRVTTTGHTLMVVPFENRSAAPGLDWIGEAFAEVLGQRLATPGAVIIGRQDRLYAFERLGLPADLQLSRATLVRIAQEMDLDYIVIGSYTFDGESFSAEGQLLDMNKLKLGETAKASGTLPQLVTVQYSLAWELLRHLDPLLAVSRTSFVAQSPSVRLDAFENYIRGRLAQENAAKVKFLREAVRINPNYTEARLQLGRTQFEMREYDAAIQSLAAIADDAESAGEAHFYLGLAYMYKAQFDKAEQAFREIAARLPLTEVVNNLGVAMTRRGKNALEQFQQAAQYDPRDADYRFNLAVALYRTGDQAGAARQLRELLEAGDDQEAKAFLAAMSNAAFNPASPVAATQAMGLRIPLTRIKRNYDETSFRQLALEIQNARESRLKDMPPAQHAESHLQQGLQFLEQKLLELAEREFREAILLDPANAASHAGLADVLERRNDVAGAQAEAQASLRLRPSARAYVVLARLDLRENNVVGATANVQQALQMEPGNAAAAELNRAIAAKPAGKGQPLRKP